jgi:hypothetical protein
MAQGLLGPLIALSTASPRPEGKAAQPSDAELLWSLAPAGAA